MSNVEKDKQLLLMNSNEDNQPNLGSSELDNSSVIGNADLAIQKKYFAYEEALKRRAGIYPIISLVALYFISIAVIIGLFYLIMSMVSNKAKLSSIRSQINLHFDDQGFELYKLYSRLLKKTAFEEGIITKDRYTHLFVLLFRYAKFNFSEKVQGDKKDNYYYK